jgi:NAD(P)-dependent dehydrogenase (short-subunit alcohol dehydrogenase family)
VVLADIEAPVLASTVAELSAHGQVHGVRTDVSDETSVTALADQVWARHGRCDLLFLNAGVTSGGGGLPGQQAPNDGRGCCGVPVFGVGIGVSEFVPACSRTATRSGRGDLVGRQWLRPGGDARVYAASKAAVSCFTEALQLNLVQQDAALRASVFYPSGGLMDTGLYTAARNRPEHLQRTGEGTGRAGMTFEQLRERVSSATGRDAPVADVAALGEFAVQGAVERRFVIAHDLDSTAELLHRRADAIGRAELPPAHRLGV